MKNTKSYTKGLIAAVSEKKDVFFHVIAKALFNTPNDVDGEANMIAADASFVLNMKDGSLITVSRETIGTAEEFKAEIGMTLQEAICKAEFITYTTPDQILIWGKSAAEYLKYEWQCVLPEKPVTEPKPRGRKPKAAVEAVAEPTETEPEVEPETEPEIPQELFEEPAVENAMAAAPTETQETIGDESPAAPKRKKNKK